MKQLRSGGPGRQDWSTSPRYDAAAAGFRGYWFPGPVPGHLRRPVRLPRAEAVRRAIFAGEVAVIDDGVVPLMEQLPEEVADVITEFLS